MNNGDSLGWNSFAATNTRLIRVARLSVCSMAICLIVGCWGRPSPGPNGNGPVREQRTTVTSSGGLYRTPTSTSESNREGSVLRGETVTLNGWAGRDWVAVTNDRGERGYVLSKHLKDVPQKESTPSPETPVTSPVPPRIEPEYGPNDQSNFDIVKRHIVAVLLLLAACVVMSAALIRKLGARKLHITIGGAFAGLRDITGEVELGESGTEHCRVCGCDSTSYQRQRSNNTCPNCNESMSATTPTN